LNIPKGRLEAEKKEKKDGQCNGNKGEKDKQ
jgi:hypothetical protein